VQKDNCSSSEAAAGLPRNENAGDEKAWLLRAFMGAHDRPNSRHDIPLILRGCFGARACNSSQHGGFQPDIVADLNRNLLSDPDDAARLRQCPAQVSALVSGDFIWR
jgi:hypothetical protein